MVRRFSLSFLFCLFVFRYSVPGEQIVGTARRVVSRKTAKGWGRE